MLQQPADAPPPLTRVQDLEPVRALRSELVSRQRSGPASFRRWAGRVSGRADRRLMLVLAEATEALADHADLLVDRLTTLEALGADATGVLGEELTRLRAEVLHLQRVATSSPRPPA
jgi:hypothetical protein